MDKHSSLFHRSVSDEEETFPRVWHLDAEVCDAGGAALDQGFATLDQELEKMLKDRVLTLWSLGKE